MRRLLRHAPLPLLTNPTTRGRRPLAALAGVALVSLLLSACGASSQADKPSSGRSPVSGGKLVELVTSLGTSWQQQDVYSWYDAQVWAQLVETLVYVDDKGKVEPWLATSWKVGDHGLRYDLTIKKGVTFSDGTPLTARVVADNLNLLGLGDDARGIGRLSGFPTGYVGAKDIGNSVVRVTLSEPDSGFLPTLGYFQAGILAPKTIDASRESQAKLENVIGTGPFVLDSYTPEKQIVLKRRTGYDWPHEGASHAGAAYLDTVTFRTVAEDSVRLGALTSGQADVIHYVQPSEEAGLESKGFKVVVAQYLSGADGLELRPSAAIVDDVDVRRAIQHGIDRKELIDTVFSRNWSAATSILTPSVPGWVDLSDDLKFDPALSKQLLDKAGWGTIGADGIRTKDGRPLSLVVYPSPYQNTSSAEIQLVAQQLKEVGIKLDIRQSDFSSYQAAIKSDALPIQETHYSVLDPDYLYSWYGAKNENRLRANDAKLDELLRKLAVTPASAEKDRYTEQAQRYLIDQAYFIPLENPSQVYAMSSKVHNFVTNGVGRPFFYEAWLAS